MAFLVVNPAPIKTISLLLLTFLIWHGGTSANVIPAVTSFTATETRETSGSSVLLTWSIPTNANASRYTYDIEVSTNTASVRNVTNINGNNVTVHNLDHGVNYTFKIYTNDSGSFSSASSTSITTHPSPVTNLNIVSSTTTSLTLSWVAPSDINPSTYSYLIIVSNGSNTWNITTVQNVETRVVDGLLPGVNYNFTVYTRTSDSVLSTASLSINGTTNPSPVTILNIVSSTTASLNLSWDAPNNLNTATYSYLIIVSNGSNTWNITTAQNALTHQVNGLSPGVNYKFTVYTRTSDSVLSTAFLSINGTTNPFPINNLRISSTTTTTLTLSWEAPNDINKATYIYVITVSNSSNTWNINTLQNANSTEIPNLLPGVKYSFTVHTQTINGVQSTESLSLNGTTNPSPVNSITLVNRSNSSITIMWTTPSDVRVKEYEYNVFYTATKIVTLNNIYTAPGLQPGSRYVFNVTSEIDGMTSVISTFTVYSVPNQPGNLGGGSVNTSSINVSWQAPNDPNANSYEYNVTWIEGVSQNTTGNDNTYNTSMVIQGLQAGYQYGVIIHSMIGGASSEPSTIYLLTDPNIIKSPEIGNITNSSVIFRWTWPESGVTGMEIKSTTANAATIEIITDRSITEYEMTNLTPGNFYEFTLRSYKNSDNDVLSSGRIHRREAAPTERTTYSEPVTRTIQILPAHVTNIQCSKVGGGYAIIVHFICPEGNFTELNVLVNGGTSDALTNCSGSGEVTVRSLQPANGYDVRVQTVAYPLTVLTIIHRCSTDNVGVIVGAIFGVLLFLLLVGLIAFFILRKRRSKKPEMEIPDVKKQRRFRTLSKEQFADYFQQQHANSDFGFAEEYQELGSVGTKQLKREAELPDNRSKNRFTNVLPYDHSRVKLDSTGGNEISDYINANYMPGYNATKEFIASQGPLPNTNADFWRMIWEHRVNTIVMLTNCMENGRTKCEHYWPLDYTPCTYGDITVTVTSETILTEWTIRDFSLKHARQQDVKQVRHFHFTVWPDHGVPENTNDIIQFRSLVREHMDQQKSNGPAVVHCSAGVGRTGTLIALDYLIQQMEKENRISAYGIVEKMRMNRPLMVQTESQYVFLNKCMLSLIEQPEEENIYENQGSDLIYENANVIRNCQNDRV